MSEPPLQYADPEIQISRPTRHSRYTSLSLLVVILAVALKIALVGYAYWRWQTYTLDRLGGRLLRYVPDPTLWFVLGATFAIIATVQPDRRRWAAVVAFALNAFFLYGQLAHAGPRGHPPWWSW